MGLLRRGAWAKRDLGSRLRMTIQRAQGNAVGDKGSGRLCYQTIQEPNRRSIIGRGKSGVAQSKDGAWGRIWDTSGDGERSRK